MAHIASKAARKIPKRMKRASVRKASRGPFVFAFAWIA
jgi:hypothetical protein